MATRYCTRTTVDSGSGTRPLADRSGAVVNVVAVPMPR
jgi:hypothetical protein